MLLRILSIVIIGFWLATVGWLCSVVWAPPESRMVEIDPREAYEIFFNWNESTNMTLLENGRRRGQITISGGSGVNPERGMTTRTLSVSGMLEELSPDPAIREIDLFWRGVLEFDEEMEMLEGDFSIRIPSRSITAHLELAGPPPRMSFRALSNQVEIFSYEGEVAGGKIPMQALPMASVLGLGEISTGGTDIGITARMGTFTFAGRDLRAYLLTFRGEANQESGEVRVYLSEAGEPLRLESNFGLEAISEILVPLDAYETPDEADAS